MEKEPWASSVLIAITRQCQGPPPRLLPLSQLPLAPAPLPAKSPGLTHAVVSCLRSPPARSTAGRGAGGRYGKKKTGEEKGRGAWKACSGIVTETEERSRNATLAHETLNFRGERKRQECRGYPLCAGNPRGPCYLPHLIYSPRESTRHYLYPHVVGEETEAHKE